MKLCSIIILTCNALSFTRICLESLFQYTYPPYEVIIVDNGSTDGTVSFLNNLALRYDRMDSCRSWNTTGYSYNRLKNDLKTHQSGPHKITILRNSFNVGFAGGCNQGARIARGDSLLFLNNDTMVGKNWLDNLLYCLNSSPVIAAVNPCSNFNPYAQVDMPYQDLNHIQGFNNSFNRPDPGKWRESNKASGFCLLVKRTLFEKIGGFDERFEIGCYEDTDLTFRLVKAGYKIMIAGDTYVHHFGGRSFVANDLNINNCMDDNFRKYREKHLLDG